MSMTRVRLVPPVTDARVSRTLKALTGLADAVADEEFRQLVRRYSATFKGTLKGKDLVVYERRLEPLMRDEEPSTLQEVGDEFGVTRERVRQLEVRVKKRLAEYLQQRIPDLKEIEFGTKEAT